MVSASRSCALLRRLGEEAIAQTAARLVVLAAHLMYAVPVGLVPARFVIAAVAGILGGDLGEGHAQTTCTSFLDVTPKIAPTRDQLRTINVGLRLRLRPARDEL